MTNLPPQCTPLGPDGLAGWLELALDATVDPRDRRVVAALSTTLAAARWARRRRGLERAVASGFPTAITRDVARNANALGAQVAVEELLLGRLTPANIDGVVRWEGRHNLDAALANGRGVALLFPHAGFQKGLIARLGLSEYRFTQVALRGLPPAERANSPHSARIAARERREDRLPVRFHDLGSPTRALVRDLADNRVVGLAYDGRGGGKFANVRYLGRPAWLATGPWRLAVATHASIVPAFVRLDADRGWTAVFGEPVAPCSNADSVRDHLLTTVFEPWLRRHPEHYAPWIDHCARHADRDDHPLFPRIGSTTPPNSG